jgi:1-acyl-sn-glycerol-3-phosphate acyltransferase
VPEPDPLAARSPAAIALFDAYLRVYFRRNFRAVRVLRDGHPRLPAGRPVIVASNHPSWWDPMMFVLLSRLLLPERIGYGPMEAAALKRYGVLRRIGVFGIEPGTVRGASQFLRLGARVLADPRGALWVTAEGAFTDARRRPVRLRPGIAALARRVPVACVLPLALEYPFWNERRPEALACFGPALEGAAARETGAIEAALALTMDRLADAAMTRDPARFTALLRGRAGVGGA